MLLTNCFSWTIDDGEYPTAVLGKVRERLQRLEKIKKTSADIVAAAEALIPNLMAKLMQFGLTSLPMEIIQEIIRLSTLDELRQTFKLKRVLELQLVSRYFQDVIRSTPELWTSVSTTNASLFRLQLERCGEMELHVVMDGTSSLTTEMEKLLTTHSARFRTLVVHIHVPEQRSFVAHAICFLDMKKLQSLELRTSRSPGESLDFQRLRAPRLNRLLFSNVLDIRGTVENLTELVISYKEHWWWSSSDLISLIRRHEKLEKLVLCLRSLPSDYSEFEADAEDLTDSCPTSRRDMIVVLKLDSWASRNAFSPIWPALLGIGVGTLKLDLSDVSLDVLAGCMASALHFCCAPATFSFHTLFISFPPHASRASSLEGVRFGWQLPLSLRTVTVHNCAQALFTVLLQGILVLEAEQKAFGAEPIEEIFFTGCHPPDTFVDEFRRFPYSRLIGFTVSLV